MTNARIERRSRPAVALVVGLLLNLATLARLPAQRPERTDSTNPSPLVGVNEAAGGAVLLAGAFLFDRSFRTELQADRSPAGNRLARVGNAFGNGLYVLPPIAAGYLVGRLGHQPRVTRAALPDKGGSRGGGNYTSATVWRTRILRNRSHHVIPAPMQ